MFEDNNQKCKINGELRVLEWVVMGNGYHKCSLQKLITDEARERWEDMMRWGPNLATS
jgi:hypothetical protein